MNPTFEPGTPMQRAVRAALDVEIPIQQGPAEFEMEHRLRAAFARAREVALVGAEIDGEHHKQWALVEVCRLLGVGDPVLEGLDEGTPP